MRDYAAEGLFLLGKMHEVCCSVISEDNFLSIWRSTRFPGCPFGHLTEKVYIADRPESQNGNSCARINRHEVENAGVSRERDGDPLGPEFCAGHREVHGEA